MGNDVSRDDETADIYKYIRATDDPVRTDDATADIYVYIYEKKLYNFTGRAMSGDG